jgi:hypothetical protein
MTRHENQRADVAQLIQSADSTSGNPTMSPGGSLTRKRRFFPNANLVSGVPLCKGQMRQEAPRRIDKGQWLRFLDRKLRSMILKSGGMPTLEEFEASVFKPGSLSTLPRESRSELRLAVKKAQKVPRLRNQSCY